MRDLVRASSKVQYNHSSKDNAMKKLLTSVLFSLVFMPGLVLAQSATIEGTVVDATGEPLIGANVIIEEMVLGASTDLNGKYSFVVPADMVEGQTVTLFTGYVGYSDMRKSITLNSGLQTHDFQLEEDLLKLDEVVVTGVTEATPTKKLAFTVSKLDSPALQQAPGSSAVESLQGKVAGASVIRNSGAPGDAISVRLRGSTSITGSSEPLYIVDGVILGANQVDIGALDIESMEVVKGAAASSLYGARAQNGVVNIKTKRGSDLALNQTRITFRNEFGINDLENNLDANQAHPFLLNASGQFLDPDGNVIPYGPGVIEDNVFNGVAFADKPYANTQAELFDAFDTFFDPGNTMTNYISVSQNGLKTNFHASFANTEEAGILTGLNGYERKEARINLDHRISRVLSFSASGFYSQSTSDAPESSIGQSTVFGNPFFGIMFTNPLVNLSARDDDGNLFVQADPLAVEENPLYVIENSDIEQRRSRTLGSFRGEYRPADWVRLEGNFSYDRSDRDQAEFYDRGYETIDPNAINDGQVERRNAFTEAVNYDVTASFNRSFGDFTLRSQLKYQHEFQDGLSEFIIGSGLVAQGNFDLSNIRNDSQISRGNTRTRIISDGYYGTFGIDFQDKYIADFLIRRDGSSLFGEDERWHNYFRVSGAYRVSEEDWWPVGATIPEFKLRASYGTAGGRPRFEAQYETFTLTNGQLNKNTLGNSLLKPELQKELELGVDIGILDRVFVEFVYADSEVEDQLLLVPLAGYFGFASQWQNAGTLASETFEVSVNANLIRTRDMSLDLGVIFDRTTQEITEFDTNPYQGGPNNGFFFREGETLGSMYGWQVVEGVSDLPTEAQGFADLFDVNDDGYLVAVGAGNTFQDGISSQLWGTTVDVGGVSYDWGMPIRRTEADGTQFTKIGDVLPDFNIGVPINFRYKGFRAGMLWNAQVGGDIYNFTKQWSYRDGRAADQDQSGKADGLKKPTDYYEFLYDATAANSHFIEDGTYVRLRELSLGYTFERAQLARVFGNALSRVTLSFIGRNLFTFTDYTGFDPEVGSTEVNADTGGDVTLYRVDNFEYPNFRTFTGRLEIQF